MFFFLISLISLFIIYSFILELEMYNSTIVITKTVP